MSAAIPVLVVDDEPSLRRLLRTSLSAQGYRVLEAGTGQGAIDSLARDGPEVVLLDLGLPDMDGLEVIRRVRTSGFKTPVIVLSSRGNERGKVQALDLGADDYVTSMRLSASGTWTMRLTKIPGVTMWSGSISPDCTRCSTSATVTLPALAIIGLKLRAVLR
jgi:CheY-like chemotaxis protein